MEIAHCTPLSPQSVSSHLISTHLMSSEFCSPHLSSSQLMSSNQILSQLIWCCFIFFEINLLSCGISWLFISCQNIWSLISFSFFIFFNFIRIFSYFWLKKTIANPDHCRSNPRFGAADLHLPFNLFPKPNKTPQQPLPCRRHKQFRVVVSAVSDPWVHWGTHSKPSRREAPTQKGFYTAKLLHTASFHTENPLHTEAFSHCKLLHTASFYTEQALTQRSFRTEKLSHREAFTHRSFYTHKLLHTASFYTEKLLHREALHGEAFTRRSIYTQKLLHTATFYTETFTHSKFSYKAAFTQTSFCTQKLLHTASVHTERP